MTVQLKYESQNGSLTVLLFIFPEKLYGAKQLKPNIGPNFLWRSGHEPQTRYRSELCLFLFKLQIKRHCAFIYHFMQNIIVTAADEMWLLSNRIGATSLLTRLTPPRFYLSKSVSHSFTACSPSSADTKAAVKLTSVLQRCHKQKVLCACLRLLGPPVCLLLSVVGNEASHQWGWFTHTHTHRALSRVVYLQLLVIILKK